MNDSKVRIKEIKGSYSLSKFIKFPYKIYANDKAWVPPLMVERKEFLNPNKNPFFKHAEVRYFMAYKDGEPVGRIASIINHNHNSFHDEKTAFFGLFECIDDPIVAYGLFDKAKEIAKLHGMDKLRGPVNFSTNDEAGLLIEGFFTPPAIMMTYNPTYYPALLEKFGLKKIKDLYAYYMERSRGIPERMRSAIERIKQRYRVQVRPFNPKKFDEELIHLKTIYNSILEKNWGFIPITDDEFSHMAVQLKQIYDPDLIFLAFINGKPVGFSLSLPNFNEILIKLNGKLLPTGLFKLLYYTKFKRTIRGLRVIIMGVIPEYQKRGIDNIFYDETFKTGLKKGYRWAELSWILEDNDMMNKAAKLLNAKLYKKYRIYEMDVY